MDWGHMQIVNVYGTVSNLHCQFGGLSGVAGFHATNNMTYQLQNSLTGCA